MSRLRVASQNDDESQYAELSNHGIALLVKSINGLDLPPSSGYLGDGGQQNPTAYMDHSRHLADPERSVLWFVVAFLIVTCACCQASTISSTIVRRTSGCSDRRDPEHPPHDPAGNGGEIVIHPTGEGRRTGKPGAARGGASGSHALAMQALASQEESAIWWISAGTVTRYLVRDSTRLSRNPAKRGEAWLRITHEPLEDTVRSESVSPPIRTEPDDMVG
jgi:hypothetical protein